LRREGLDLLLEVPITVREAMLGAKIEVPTLDGTIKLTVPAGSQTGGRLRLKEKGVPASGRRAAGDLYVTLRVQVPDAASDPDAARRAADELESLYGGDVRAGLQM
jgi:DnaJ-class molecular chaperone